MDRARFLLAQLHLDSLKDKTSPKLIKKALEALPKGSNALDLAYNGAMQRIEDQLEGFRLLAKQLLGWLTYSQRLMNVQEVQHALAIEPGAPDFDEDNLGDIDEIVGFCAGLVIIDEETHIIRLVHYTTQEYFRRNGEILLASARVDIAISCLTYLLYENFGAGWVVDEVPKNAKHRHYARPLVSSSVRARIQKYPFLEYADMYWAYHTRGCEQRNVKELFMKFAKDDRKVSGASQVVLALKKENSSLEVFNQTKSRNPLSAMHIIAYFGYEEMISELLHHGFAADTEDSIQRIPLWWASWQGHGAVVSLLLSQKHVNVNRRGRVDQISFETPLGIAIKLGYAQVVKLLIQREDVDVNLPNIFGSSPLDLAVRQRNSEILGLLLTREDIDVNARDGFGKTPLSIELWRMRRRFEILTTNGRVNLEDVTGRTALHRATEQGYSAIVKLLISHADTDVNAKDESDWTALHVAAQQGRTSKVELLLGCVSIDVNSRDRDGSTPLHRAAEHGYEAIVTVLFGKSDIEVNPKNYNGHTPLTDSIISHHPAVVRLFCAHPDVDLDPKDSEGRDMFSLVKLEQERLTRYGEDDPSKKNSSKRGSRVSAAEATLRLEECLEILRTAIETRAQNGSRNLQPVPS